MMTITKNGFINEAGQPIDFEFDGKPRFRTREDGSWDSFAGYTREQLEASIHFEKRTGIVPSPLEVLSEWDGLKNQKPDESMGGVVEAVRMKAKAVIDASKDFEPMPGTIQSQESTELSAKVAPALASGKWIDVYFNFRAELVTVNTKGGGEKERATEIKLSTTEVSKLLELASEVGNNVDAEIKISRWVKAPKLSDVPEGEVANAIKNGNAAEYDHLIETPELALDVEQNATETVVDVPAETPIEQAAELVTETPAEVIDEITEVKPLVEEDF
jgi:hypothetical protein